jgi:hypothetical protein
VLLWLSVPPFPLCFSPPFPPFPPFPPYSETTLSSLTAPGTVNSKKQFYLLFHDLSIILEHCNGPCSVHLRLTCSPFVLSASIVLHLNKSFCSTGDAQKLRSILVQNKKGRTQCQEGRGEERAAGERISKQFASETVNGIAIVWYTSG